MTQIHAGFWDCFESEATKQRLHRRVGDRGDEDSYLVTIYECAECGNIGVCETYDNGGEWEGTDEWWTANDEATVASIAKTYDW